MAVQWQWIGPFWYFFFAFFCHANVDIPSTKNVSVSQYPLDSPVDDIQWCGPNHTTVLVKTVNGRIYRSENGGKQWSDLTDYLNSMATTNDVRFDSILINSIDKSNIVLIGTQTVHFFSRDAGKTFSVLDNKNRILIWHFHPTLKDSALMITWSKGCHDTDMNNCSQVLYVTHNFGKSFSAISSHVVQANWADITFKKPKRIYFTAHQTKNLNQPRNIGWTKDIDFRYTDDDGKTSHTLIPGGNKFLVSNGYIFVAASDNVEKQTVKLMVSKGNDYNFTQALLPVDLQEKSYNILDTSEGAVILHVNHWDDTRHTGNVYISDESGTRFSLSLPDVIRTENGDCEFDQVLSLEGVYIANFKEFPSQEDEHFTDDMETGVDQRRKPKARAKQEEVIRTVISFDKGGIWSYIRAPPVDSQNQPTKCPIDRCWLHLHGITNTHEYAPFYSVENAVGIIMATGNIGNSLRHEVDQVNTYLSRDGGLTWIEAHKGAYIYEFGDHGGLILMADDVRRTKQVVFSWNEGLSWYDFDIGTTAISVDNIVTEPNSISLEFLLYGINEDSGVIYHLDFAALGERFCTGDNVPDSSSSDYETWEPTDGRHGLDKCLLGRHMFYVRRKQSSECFNGMSYKKTVLKQPCSCTQEDFECEYGFTREIGSSICRLQNASLTHDGCTSSGFFMANAYRKVPGDACENGWMPEKVAVPCPAHSPFSSSAKFALIILIILGILLGVINYSQQNPRLKYLFQNYGFKTSIGVRYAPVGKDHDDYNSHYEPELGFIDSEREEQEDEVPKLMTFSDSKPSTRANEGENHELSQIITRRTHISSASQNPMPLLNPPPSSSSYSQPNKNFNLDLL